MTLLAPSKRRGTPKAPEPDGAEALPLVIGLQLAPASQLDRLEVAGSYPVRLGAAARLGAALLLFIGLMLQRTMLPLLPWGPADLVTVLVAVVGLYAGPAAGCLSGFGIGLVADVLSDHALGRLAAVLCVIGYACGMLAADAARRRWLGWLVVGAACAVTPLLFALTGAFVGDTRAAGMLLVQRCVAGLCYGLVLAPFVDWIVRRSLSPRLARRRRLGRQARP